MHARGSLSAEVPGRALELLDSKRRQAVRKLPRRLAESGAPSITPALASPWPTAFRGATAADDFGIFCELFCDWADARPGLRSPGKRVAPHSPRAHEEIGHSIRQTNALNLDRRQTMLDALTVIGEAASRPPEYSEIFSDMTEQDVLHNDRNFLSQWRSAYRSRL